MKHIKRKFLSAHKISDKVQEHLVSLSHDKKAFSELKIKDYEGYYGMLITDTDAIQAFEFKKDNKTYFIPEPDPIVIYFSNAQYYLKYVLDSKKELFKDLDDPKPNTNKILHSFYGFYGCSTSYILFLFNSLEAFLNSLIPSDYQYIKDVDRKNKIYNKEKIQKYLPFEEKLKNIIPQITNKNFHSEFGNKYDAIIKLKGLRDEIVHTKTDDKSKPNYYQRLYTLALNFDYKETIYHVKDLINFYKPVLIEECNCGADF